MVFGYSFIKNVKILLEALPGVNRNLEEFSFKHRVLRFFIPAAGHRLRYL